MGARKDRKTISAPLNLVSSRRFRVYFLSFLLDLPEDGEGEPKEEDELEDKVKGEPVDDVDEAFNDSEEREYDPVLR